MKLVASESVAIDKHRNTSNAWVSVNSANPSWSRREAILTVAEWTGMVSCRTGDLLSTLDNSKEAQRASRLPAHLKPKQSQNSVVCLSSGLWNTRHVKKTCAIHDNGCRTCWSAPQSPTTRRARTSVGLYYSSWSGKRRWQPLDSCLDSERSGMRFPQFSLSRIRDVASGRRPADRMMLQTPQSTPWGGRAECQPPTPRASRCCTSRSRDLTRPTSPRLADRPRPDVPQ